MAKYVRAFVEGCIPGTTGLCAGLARLRAGRLTLRPWFAALLIAGGCDALFGPPFVPGTYVDDVPCILSIEDESGSMQTEDYDAALTLVIAADGGLTINGEDVAVGQPAVRAIPTADLAFEVVEVIRQGRFVTIRYEPRPTLPGITVDGSLEERYRWRAGSIDVIAAADLELTDVATTTPLTVECRGTLVGP